MKTIIVIAILGLMFALAWFSASVDINKCEQAGGIFYSGFFGADNCVFPLRSIINNMTQSLKE